MFSGEGLTYVVVHGITVGGEVGLSRHVIGDFFLEIDLLRLLTDSVAEVAGSAVGVDDELLDNVVHVSVCDTFGAV